MTSESPQQTEAPPTFWQKACWPIIICVLLGSHAMLMMVALSLSLAGPPDVLPEDLSQTTLGQPPAQEIVLPNSDKR